MLKIKSLKKMRNRRAFESLLSTFNFKLSASPAFTLIETLVAISLLTIAIVAPMSLTAQSLATAYYARDQITAFYMAQEAIEAVRGIRDDNILINAQGTPRDLLTGIPSTSGQPFVIDARDGRMNLCSGICPPLRTDGTFYAYGPIAASDIYAAHDDWADTHFVRTLTVQLIGASNDEVKVTVKIDWQTGGYQVRHFILSENLYRWVADSTTTP